MKHSVCVLLILFIMYREQYAIQHTIQSTQFSEDHMGRVWYSDFSGGYVSGVLHFKKRKEKK